MTNQYMNNLYRDLLSNSPQTITIDIPADMGTGQILQVVTKQGAVVSDGKWIIFQIWTCREWVAKNTFKCCSASMMVFPGILQIADKVSAYKKVSPVFIVDTGKMEYLCYSKQNDFLFKNVKVPLSYFRKLWMTILMLVRLRFIRKNYWKVYQK